MAEHDAPVRRPPRRHSEQRQRQDFVGVRFSSEEFSVLKLAEERTGKSRGALLREAFLSAERDAAASHHEVVQFIRETQP